MYEIRDYVNDVMAHVSADEATRARLTEDLTAHLEEAAEQDGVRAAIERMGSPEDMARDLTDILYEDRSSLVRELVQARREVRQSYGQSYEYVSPVRVLGIPLVHVKLSLGSRRYGARKPAVAKGIIAVGDVAIGAVAVGGIALGGICVGGIGLGLMTLAGIALGLIIAVGGIALGWLAMGGIAVGIYAFGGLAVAARVACGGFSYGTIAIGGDVNGVQTFSNNDAAIHSVDMALQARIAIEAKYPGTPNWIIRLFTAVLR